MNIYRCNIDVNGFKIFLSINKYYISIIIGQQNFGNGYNYIGFYVL